MQYAETPIKDDKDCPSCMKCIHNECSRIECLSHCDCGPMFVCRDNKCAPEKCFKDYECGWNMRCFKGSCFNKPPKQFVNPTIVCKRDEDCNLNQNFNGRCLKVYLS